MPFTFSHPAAAFPLLALPQRWRSATGLIIGSMTPDFEKFIRMSIHDPHSHTWQSIFYFNIPMGVLLAFVFHWLVRDAFIAHSPVFVRQRFGRFMAFEWGAYFKKHYAVFLFSLFLGIVSHLVWDSFTHKEGRGVRLMPFLNTKLTGSEDPLYLFEVMQMVSSAVGVALILYFILTLKKRPLALRPSALGVFLYWAGIGVVALVVFMAKTQVGDGIRLHDLLDTVITSISCGLISLVLVSAFFKTRLSTYLKN